MYLKATIMSRTSPIFLSLMPIHSITIHITLEEFVCEMYGSCQHLVILCSFLNLTEKFKPHDNENPL